MSWRHGAKSEHLLRDEVEKIEFTVALELKDSSQSAPWPNNISRTPDDTIYSLAKQIIM